MAKRVRCYLGFHKWVTAGGDGERYLACKYCKKYGSSPSHGPFTYGGSRER